MRVRVQTGETTYRRRDGSTLPVEARRTVLETADGPILVVNSRDLTERKVEEARKSAHLRYQQRIAAFGQSALARRDPQELAEDAVQQVLLALGADAVAYVERGPERGQLVGARACRRRGDRRAHRDIRPAIRSRMCSSRACGSRPSVHPAVRVGAVRRPRPRSCRCRAIPACAARFARSRARGSFGAEELNFLDAVAAVLTTGLKRVASEERLAFLAQFDSLTGLPNRALLADRFAQMIDADAPARARPRACCSSTSTTSRA